ncbi:MAG: lysophospholipid acyltransferase family protein [bacterium]
MINKFVTYLLLFLGFISSKLSIKKRSELGRLIGNILRVLSTKRKNITYTNLKNAFPEKSEELINDILIKSYQNLGIVLIEVLSLKYLDDDDINKYVHYENLDLILDVYNRGNGLILLSAHFGNWEFAAYAVGLFTKIPIKIIVKEQQNTIADKVLNEYRAKAGNEVVFMNKAARKIINALFNKECVAILADQRATKDKDVYVDFFGMPASTYEAPASLALKFKVPVIYGFAVRNKDGTYTVKAKELKTDDLENNADDIKILTQRHVNVLEDAIREHPELWTWQHNRWKYKLL